MHSGCPGALLVPAAVADVKRPRGGDAEALERELEDVRVGLCRARVGRRDDGREGRGEPELLETLEQRQVEVGDDGQLEPAAPEVPERFGHSGHDLEIHRRHVERGELDRVDAVRAELPQKDAGALVLERRERRRFVRLHRASRVDRSLGLDGAADLARRPVDPELGERTIEFRHRVDEPDERSVRVERDGVEIGEPAHFGGNIQP